MSMTCVTSLDIIHIDVVGEDRDFTVPVSKIVEWFDREASLPDDDTPKECGAGDADDVTIGDVVVLNSGSPTMTVEAISSDGTARCTWWDDHSKEYQEVDLLLVCLSKDI